MPRAIESQIKERIESFVTELDKLVRMSTLEALQGVLATGGLPIRRGRPAGARRGPGRPRSSATGDVDQAAAKILDHVRSNDGQGISAIATGAGLALPVAKRAAAQLIGSGALKKSGQKRGTVYHIGSGKPVRSMKAGRRGKRRSARKAKAA